MDQSVTLLNLIHQNVEENELNIFENYRTIFQKRLKEPSEEYNFWRHL